MDSRHDEPAVYGDDRYHLTDAGRAAVAADPVGLLHACARDLNDRAEARRRHAAGGCPDAEPHLAVAAELDELAGEYHTRALKALNGRAGGVDG